jgi:23S rRNA (guanosine2251-2'-O)-methyltransferase
VCGLQPVREVIRAHGGRTLRVVVEHGDSPTLDAVARFATDHGITVERASRAELERLASGARHQGVVAFAPDLVVHTSTADLAREGSAPLFLCLDELEDPQNFGAIVRSAVAFSASAIVWPAHHSAPLSAATFRASAGAIEHATLVRVPALPSELSALKERGVEVIGLDAEAKHALADLELEGPLAIVVGSEGKGLRKPVKQACTRLARLPMSRSIGSLNASVAAAIALYEVTRQRRPRETE